MTKSPAERKAAVSCKVSFSLHIKRTAPDPALAIYSHEETKKIHPMPTATATRAEAAATAAASIDSVSKLYGTFAALRNVTTTFAAGTSTVILGENGAGKSTLLRVIAGLITPTRGTATVFGEQPHRQRRRMAYMSHAPMLYDE